MREVLWFTVRGYQCGPPPLGHYPSLAEFIRYARLIAHWDFPLDDVTFAVQMDELLQR